MKPMFAFLLLIGAMAFPCCVMSGDYLVLSYASGPRPVPGTSTAVTFYDYQLQFKGLVPSTEFPAVAPGPDQKYWVAYAHGTSNDPDSQNSTTSIIEYDPSTFSVVDRYEHPNALDGTDLTFAPVNGVNLMVVTSNGIVWLQTRAPNSSAAPGPHIEALNWKTKTVDLSIAPPKQTKIPKERLGPARIFPLDDGCLVTYLHYATATLYFADGRQVSCSLKAGTNNNTTGVFEVGTSKGNRAWGVSRTGNLIKVEYSKETSELRATVLGIYPWLEDKFTIPVGIMFDEGENLLAIMSTDSNQIQLVRLVDPDTGKVVKTITMPGRAGAAAYHDGKLFAVLGNESRITAFDKDLKVVQRSSPLFSPLGLVP